ncbi:MAG: hypothetical protein GY812_16560 [Actinomycetia bacterium]|nr:hypothetical protein [Actinomycetes bacterium]
MGTVNRRCVLTTQTRTCPVCGSEFQNEYKRRGRPRDYCGDECRELNKLLSRVESYIEKVIDDRLERDDDGVVTEGSLAAASRLKSRLWAAGNQFNRAGRTTRAYRRRR